LSDVRWDPSQYNRFRDERARPYFDLLDQLRLASPRALADLGCGTAQLTCELPRRWPGCRVWAVDDSAEMLQRARASGVDPAITLIQADLRRWQAPVPLDAIISNAALQWVGEHEELLARLKGMLAPGGTLAVQVPNNRGEAAYRIAIEMLREEPWRRRVGSAADLPTVPTAAWYEGRLAALQMSARLWETIYYHRLESVAALAEWLRGAALRPALSALSAPDAERFLAEYRRRLADAYPSTPRGVLFPFRRLFFVAHRL